MSKALTPEAIAFALEAARDGCIDGITDIRTAIAALSAIGQVRELHKPVTMSDGEQRIVVCTHCCELDYQTSSHCADKHQHGPGKPYCTTVAAIDGEEKP